MQRSTRARDPHICIHTFLRVQLTRTFHVLQPRCADVLRCWWWSIYDDHPTTVRVQFVRFEGWGAFYTGKLATKLHMSCHMWANVLCVCARNKKKNQTNELNVKSYVATWHDRIRVCVYDVNCDWAKRVAVWSLGNPKPKHTEERLRNWILK